MNVVTELRVYVQYADAPVEFVGDELSCTISPGNRPSGSLRVRDGGVEIALFLSGSWYAYEVTRMKEKIDD